MPILTVDGFDALETAAQANRTDTFSLHLSAADQDEWRKLIESDLLRRVVALASSSSSTSGDVLPLSVFEALADCSALTNLQQLAFGPAIGADSLVALAGSPHLSGLIALHLREVPIQLESALTLLRSFRHQLTWLRLERLKLGPELIGAFDETWPLLESLQVVGTPLGDEGARALASATMPTLSDLDLGAASITAKGAAVLAASALLDNVESLTLSLNVIGPAGAKALAGSPHTRKLKHVWFAGCEVKDEGARAVADSGWKLETLDLSRCFLFDGSTLASAEFLGDLKSFNIDNNASVFQDKQSVEALLDSKLPQHFKDDVRHNREMEQDNY